MRPIFGPITSNAAPKPPFVSLMYSKKNLIPVIQQYFNGKISKHNVTACNFMLITLLTTLLRLVTVGGVWLIVIKMSLHEPTNDRLDFRKKYVIVNNTCSWSLHIDLIISSNVSGFRQLSGDLHRRGGGVRLPEDGLSTHWDANRGVLGCRRAQL